ncbi:MAG: M20 family metallopeptidase [Verrucomicrobiota bacterium]|nr:M20 family metallopeptidase [Verrucomicrobiota bacterium]MCC6819559.1 M20 family metallopeptidase [Limisphaerales bacterium]
MTPTTALEIAQALVRIPSVNPNYDTASPGEQEVARWIQAWGQTHGFETSTQPVLDGRANVILRCRNGADHPHLLFNGHTDTVGVTGMNVPPFGAEVRDGRLWGRGSADMKGPLACMLAAALQLRLQPEAWKGTLTLACVVDEEYRFRGTLALMQQLDPPDGAVVGEPTSLRVVRGCKGCLRFAIHARGRAAHSAHPERGRNAIVAMARAVLELNQYFAERLSRIHHPAFGCSTGSIGLIEGGSGVNIVPEHCRIQVDIRLLPSQDANATYQEIQTTLRSRLASIPDIEWGFDPPSVIDAGYEIGAESDLVRRACDVAATGAAEVAFYSCDASKIAAKSVPCIILGPGDIAVAHTANESIAIAELEAGTEVYLRLACRLMPPADPSANVLK